jgi:transmembrane sensor
MSTRNTIEDIAAAWVAREDGRPLDQVEQRKRDAWLAQDVRHRGAYARAHAVFLHLERARALGPTYQPDRFAGRAEDVPVRRRAGFWTGAVAASALVVAAGLLGVREPAYASGHHVTKLGEVLRLPLDDGSTVTLNSSSEVVVAYSANRRSVQLLRGEALFDVAKDRARPFVVSAGASEVTAVGTSFAVHRQTGDTVDVTVRQGIVKVDGARVDAVQLGANAVAVVKPQERIQIRKLAPDRVDRLLAWRNGMIAFNGDTLEHAAAEFARYSDTRILIEDPQVATRKVVGLYSANDPAGFARAVALSMGLQVEQTRHGVYLRRIPAGH